MVKLDFKISDEAIEVDILVVESKFGKDFNSTGAEKQLRASMEAFQHIKDSYGLGLSAWKVRLEEALRQLPFPKDANLDPIRLLKVSDSIDFRRMLSDLEPKI